MDWRKCYFMRIITRKRRYAVFVFVVAIKITLVLLFGQTLVGDDHGNKGYDAHWVIRIGNGQERAQVFDVNQKIINEQNDSRRPEVRHIGFLKVHKAASSTAMSIFLRFGYTRDLIFILPSSDSNVISNTESLTNTNILLPPIGKNFDILCNHVIYSRQNFQTHLPQKAVLIGILRDPFEQYVSSVHYFRSFWNERYLMKVPINNLVFNLLRFSKFYEPKSPAYSWTNNRQAFEFGFPLDLFKDPDHIRIYSYLQQLSSDFRLVMISEYFDESVILLRRYLNWSVKDVLYISKNRSKFSAKKMEDNIEHKLLHRRLATLDIPLYDFFFQKFWKQIRQEGDGFQREIIYFRHLRGTVEDFCKATVKENGTLIANKNIWHEKFIIQRRDCDLLLLDELPFVERVKFKQYPELRKKSKTHKKKFNQNKRERQRIIKRKWVKYHYKGRIFHQRQIYSKNQ